MTLTEKQIDNRIKKIDDLKAEKKAIEKRIEALEAEIKNTMQDAETIKTDNYIVKWTYYTGNSFDSKAFKEKHKKLYEQFTKQTESRRFSYKQK